MTNYQAWQKLRNENWLYLPRVRAFVEICSVILSQLRCCETFFDCSCVCLKFSSFGSDFMGFGPAGNVSRWNLCIMEAHLCDKAQTRVVRVFSGVILASINSACLRNRKKTDYQTVKSYILDQDRAIQWRHSWHAYLEFSMSQTLLSIDKGAADSLTRLLISGG